MYPREILDYLHQVVHRSVLLHATSVVDREASRDFGHFFVIKIEKALDEIAVDETLALFDLEFRVETSPKVVLDLADALDNRGEPVLELSEKFVKTCWYLSHKADRTADSAE